VPANPASTSPSNMVRTLRSECSLWYRRGVPGHRRNDYFLAPRTARIVVDRISRFAMDANSNERLL
jgi:hypothetical protein